MNLLRRIAVPILHSRFGSKVRAHCVHVGIAKRVYRFAVDVRLYGCPTREVSWSLSLADCGENDDEDESKGALDLLPPRSEDPATVAVSTFVALFAFSSSQPS